MSADHEHGLQRTAARRSATAARERPPAEELEVEHRAQGTELARRAHAVNLDLGSALLDRLSVVDPADIQVARFFAYGLLGADTPNYLGTGDHTARVIAANGLRLVLEEHGSTETPTLKSGKPGKTKVGYSEPERAVAWLWKFIDGAKTAGELYGRVMVVFAAEHYAFQLALPGSQRRGSVLPRSHGDRARKAFEKATKSVLPATHSQLARAIEHEARQHQQRIDELRQRAERGGEQPTGTDVDEDESGAGIDLSEESGAAIADAA